MKCTEILKAEHRVIEKVLHVMADAARRVQGGQDADAEFFLRAVDFIRTYGDRFHHAKEEELLFPAMEARGIPRQSGPVGMMLMEHDQGRSHVKAMEEAANRLKSGDQNAREELAQHARSFAELLSQHIFKEDNILYPMAEQVLTPEDEEGLVERYAQAEEQLGADLGPRYVQIAEELVRAKLAVS